MPRPAAQPRRPRRRRTAARHPLDRLITGFVGAGTLLLLLPQALSHLPGQAQWDSLQRHGGVLLLLGLGLLALRLRRRPTETAPPRPEAPPSARDAALPGRLLRTPPPRAGGGLDSTISRELLRLGSDDEPASEVLNRLTATTSWPAPKRGRQKAADAAA